MINLDKKKENFLDSQYKIIEELGEFSSKIYLVEDIEDGKKYICKMYEKEKKNLFEKEYNNYKNFIDKSQSDYLIRFINSNGIDKYNVLNYIIFEYAENGSLIKYLDNDLGGFDEIYCKLIFEQILYGIKDLHNTGLCHNNLNLKNILLGENFSIKISNFCRADNKEKKIKIDKSVDKYYKPHENLLKEGKFNGIKSDFYSLGAILLELVTGKKNPLLNTNYKKYFLAKYFKIFWDGIEMCCNNKYFSEEFKKLITNMFTNNPEQIYTIDDILNSDWMAEINVDDKDKEILEEKLLEEFVKRKNKINMKENSESIMETEYEYNLDDNHNRDIGNEDILFTSTRHTAKKTKSKFPLNDIIKINYSTDPYLLMNELYKNIDKYFVDHVSFDIDEESSELKFRTTIDKKIELDEELAEKINKLILEEKEEKKDIEQKDEKNDEENPCVIDIELFSYNNEYYLLRFVRKSSDISQYKEYLKIIKSLIDFKIE